MSNNQMPKHLVIDTSVFINYTRHQKLYRLLNAIFTYELNVYLSPELLGESESNIPATSAIELPPEVYEGYIESIKAAYIMFQPIRQYTSSPEAKDNFLFNLILQTHSEIIVTKEIALLHFAASPIPIDNIKWFKETYPVPL